LGYRDRVRDAVDAGDDRHALGHVPVQRGLHGRHVGVREVRGVEHLARGERDGRHEGQPARVTEVFERVDLVVHVPLLLHPGRLVAHLPRGGRADIMGYHAQQIAPRDALPLGYQTGPVAHPRVRVSVRVRARVMVRVRVRVTFGLESSASIWCVVWLEMPIERTRPSSTSASISAHSSP